MLLSDKYPFLTEYFTKALSSTNRPLPQSILFYGNDLEAQYTLAKEIARFLNCKENKDDDCECLNCKWIRENSHPAVLTISKVDNKPVNDDAKTVISIKQSAFIKESLVNSSEFHRVFIFCDKDDDGNIAGLNQTNFKSEVANSLLKVIEEPQPGVTFIFLAKDINDLISTIISRSQCFFVPAGGVNDINNNYDYSLINNIFTNYWDFERKNTFEISQKLQNLCKDTSIIKVLDSIQNYILYALKNNPKQTMFIKHAKVVEECKKQALLGIKPVNIFDDLCLKLIK